MRLNQVLVGAVTCLEEMSAENKLIDSRNNNNDDRDAKVVDVKNGTHGGQEFGVDDGNDSVRNDDLLKESWELDSLENVHNTRRNKIIPVENHVTYISLSPLHTGTRDTQ